MSVESDDQQFQMDGHTLVTLYGRNGSEEPFMPDTVREQVGAVRDSVLPIIARIVATPHRPEDKNQLLHIADGEGVQGAVLEMARVPEKQLPSHLPPFAEYVDAVMRGVQLPVTVVVPSAMEMTPEQERVLRSHSQVVAVVTSVEQATAALMSRLAVEIA
ncbi:MAG: hypothetical protein KBD00_05560 [Candidatus Peribacteraceae bacterium]|nr:hypothetical protein [Candidatus Peribacteraceae bacterium]